MAKKRPYWLSLVVLLLVMTLAFCSSGPQLSREERVADFDYLYNALKANYPFFGVQERLHGVRWLNNYDRYLAQVRKAKNDIQFAQVLHVILSELKQGHTHLLSANSYHLFAATFTEEYLRESYTTLGLPESGREKFIEYNRPWIEPLREERVKARYAQKGASPVSKPPDPSTMPSGLTCYVLERDKIGYLAVKSFRGAERDQPIIRQFFERIQDLPYLIIDIRGNGGGNDLYWMQNIMAPLLHADLTVAFWNVWRQGHLTETFYGPSDKWRDIAELPDLPNLPQEVRDGFSHFSEHWREVKPLNPVDFQGEIFLLVDNIVFSASEAFAAVASASGWATLVGTRTGGDGIGSTPPLFSLPNSGLLVRTPLILGLNPDGSASAEVGTQPDILIAPGEDALSVVLDLIKAR